MSLEVLSTETLQHVDHGRPAAALDKAIERAIGDCMDRPGDNRPRKVTLTIAIVPVRDVVGDTEIVCDGLKAKFNVNESLPARETGECDFGVRKQGGKATAVYNPDCPNNHRQATLLEE